MRVIRAVLSLVLLMLAGAAVAAAPPAAAPKPVEIPFKFRGNHILVRGVINASDSLWFLVDTGAMASTLNRRTADRLKLKVEEGGAQARGVGGLVPAARVRGATIKLPGVALDDPKLTAIALDGLERKTGHPCDGIIGAPFFERAVIEIDYGRGVLVVHDAASYVYTRKGSSLPLTFVHNLPYVEAKVALPGADPVKGRFLIDTGSTLGLILSPSFVAKNDALTRVAPVNQVRLGGVGGKLDSQMGRLESIIVGRFALASPLGVLRTGAPGPTEAEDAIGNIGGEVLRRFRVTFDYGRSEVHFEPSNAFNEPFEADMSGLVPSVRDDSSGAIDVIIVQERSPASEQGVQPGDVLVSADGKPVAPADLVDFRRRLREPGRTVNLGLLRGDKPVAVTLVTRRLL